MKRIQVKTSDTEPTENAAFDPYSMIPEPDYYWCVHCGRTYRRGDHRTVRTRELCHYADCDGSLFADGIGWEAVLIAHPEYPAIPEYRTYYAP